MRSSGADRFQRPLKRAGRCDPQPRPTRRDQGHHVSTPSQAGWSMRPMNETDDAAGGNDRFNALSSGLVDATLADQQNEGLSRGLFQRPLKRAGRCDNEKKQPSFSNRWTCFNALSSGLVDATGGFLRRRNLRPSGVSTPSQAGWSMRQARPLD